MRHSRVKVNGVELDTRAMGEPGPGALLTWCRDHSIGMGDDVVSDLLGIGDLSERRRARFHNQIRDIATVGAAIGVATGLVMLALQAA